MVTIVHKIIVVMKMIVNVWRRMGPAMGRPNMLSGEIKIIKRYLGVVFLRTLAMEIGQRIHGRVLVAAAKHLELNLVILDGHNLNNAFCGPGIVIPS